MRKTLEEYGWIVIMIIILSIMIGMASPLATLVNDKIENTAENLLSTNEVSKQLDAPSTTIRDGVLIIRGESRSEEFGIYVNGALVDTVAEEDVDLTEYLLPSGFCTIKVVAIASGLEPSKPSAELLFNTGSMALKLSAPTLSINGNKLIITRSSVETERYEIFIDGSSKDVVVSKGAITEYDLSDLGIGSYDIEVIAKAVDKENSEKATITFDKLEKLAAPALSLEGNTLVIAGVGADEYDVYIGGSKVDTITVQEPRTEYDLSDLDVGTYVISVVAKADNKEDSAKTNITFEKLGKLNAPSLSIEDKLLIITASGATSYEVYVDGSRVATITSTTYDLSDLGVGTYTIGVVAKADYRDDSGMATISFTRLEKLATPVLSITDKRLDISNVGASAYQVSVNGSVVQTSSDRYYDLSELSAGTYMIGVVAMATGMEDSDMATISHTQLEKVATPTLTIDGETLNISVSGATTYDVYVDGSKVATLIVNTYDLSSLSSGTYTIGVVAKASGKEDSDMATTSFTRIEKLAVPTLSISDNILTISGSTGAEYYTIYVDGSSIATVTETTYDLSELDPGTYTIGVVANATDKEDSDMSTVSYTKNLDEPTYELSGAWTWNDEIVFNSAFTEAVNFTSGGEEYSALTTSAKAGKLWTMAYTQKTSGDSTVAFTLDMWKLEKSIDFGSTPQFVSEEFYTWFIMNATQRTVEYVVEIGDEDYVENKKMILVYTNEGDVNFNYDGTAFYDASGSQYKYNNTTDYTYVHALVVDKLANDTLSAYEAKIGYTFENAAEVINYTPTRDVDFDGVVTSNDYSTVLIVAQGDEYSFKNYMAKCIKADLNFDRRVNDEDVAIVMNAYKLQIDSPSLSISENTLVISGPPAYRVGDVERYEIFINDVSVANVVAINSAATYDLSYLTDGTCTVGVVAKIADVNSEMATIEYTVYVPEYVVEVESEDYVTGKKLILVYTNEENVVFKYDRNVMKDVSGSQYKYNDTTSYTYVYALVDDKLTNDTLSAYEAKITYVLDGTAEVVNYEPTYDINGDGAIDIRDITSINGVYNVDATLFTGVRYQALILRADVNFDKKVDSLDLTAVENAVYGEKLDTPTLSINGNILTITGPEGAETYTISINGSSVGDVVTSTPSAEYDLSDLDPGTYTIGVVAKATNKQNSDMATISFTAEEPNDALTAEEIEASPYLYAIGKTDPTYVVAEFNEDYSSVRIFANGEDSDGVMKDFDATNVINTNKNTLTSLTIEEGVTSIGDYTFSKCENLNKMPTLPDSLTTIGRAAFSYCTNLSGELVIPDAVTSIGPTAFYGCSGFTGNLIISESVTSIGEGAFASCSGFTGDLIIPDSVTTIGKEAFRICSGFNGYIYIGSNVQSIGLRAFEYCANLTGDLNIPNSVKTIEESAFGYCSNLNGTLTISSQISIIEASTFYDCDFVNIAIPKSVTEFGTLAFAMNSNLANIYFDGTKSEWSAISKYVSPAVISWDYKNENYVLHCADTPTLSITGNVLTITGPEGFDSYEIFVDDVSTANVTSSGTSTPYDLSDLAAGSTYSIGVVAKAGKVVSQKATVSYTATGTNDKVYTAEEIEASPYLYGIGETKPEYVVAEFNEDYSSVRIFANGEDSDGLMMDWTSATYTTSPFYLNNVPMMITIEDGVTYIGDQAFTGKDTYTGITIPQSVTKIGDGTFRDSSAINNINFVGTKAEWNTISKGVLWCSFDITFYVHCSDGDVTCYIPSQSGGS